MTGPVSAPEGEDPVELVRGWKSGKAEYDSALAASESLATELNELRGRLSKHEINVPEIGAVPLRVVDAAGRRAQALAELGPIAVAHPDPVVGVFTDPGNVAEDAIQMPSVGMETYRPPAQRALQDNEVPAAVASEIASIRADGKMAAELGFAQTVAAGFEQGMSSAQSAGTWDTSGNRTS